MDPGAILINLDQINQILQQMQYLIEMLSFVSGIGIALIVSTTWVG